MLKKKRIWILLIYLSLLAASYAVRISADAPHKSPDKKFVRLDAVEGDGTLRLAYKESGRPARGHLPVIMVHGSPGSSEVFDALVATLADRRIICVDLPGFGDSDHDIPNYSIVAHAKYLRDFLAAKKIQSAHFVGFSLGGGVVLELADMQPESIASITLLSSIGVQEYELFGDYYANHVIHGLQLGFAWLLRELTPHFGLFDGGAIEYARNFFDTDQRPLREILNKTEIPLLIIHGKDDPLVPVEAAREHARIVPQSEYVELNDNHFFVFMRPATISGKLSDFWIQVEIGTALKRGEASRPRIAAANKPFDYKVIPAKGPAVFCFFLLLFVFALLNEELSAVLAAVFVAQGRLGPVAPAIAITLAIILGSFLWRRIGRRRRGLTMKSYFPFRMEARKANAFGFRFLDNIKRSRDTFFQYAAVSVGWGMARSLLIGGFVYLATIGNVSVGYAVNSDTRLLLIVGLSIFVLKSIGIYYFWPGKWKG